jgi:hypothetical protein
MRASSSKTREGLRTAFIEPAPALHISKGIDLWHFGSSVVQNTRKSSSYAPIISELTSAFTMDIRSLWKDFVTHSKELLDRMRSSDECPPRFEKRLPLSGRRRVELPS